VARTQGWDIAILYVDKNDGDRIAAAVRETDWQFIRVDANSPYQRSPVTFWLEDCAIWCAKDWRTGNTKLSNLIHTWLAFNKSISGDAETHRLQVALVQFLHEHREPDMPFFFWLQQFLEECLEATLELEPGLRDDNEKVQALLKATSRGGALGLLRFRFLADKGDRLII